MKMWHKYASMSIDPCRYYIDIYSLPTLSSPQKQRSPFLHRKSKRQFLSERKTESSMDNPQEHHHREDPHSGGLHSGSTEGEDHHDKRSVVKKVKEKAKKIKDTIKKHGHGQHHDEHGPEFDEEDDEEDEEMVEDKAVMKGGPIRNSTVISSITIPVEEVCGGKSGPTLERTTAMKEDPHPPPGATPPTFTSHPATITRDNHVKERAPGINLGEPMELEDDPHAPKGGPDESHPDPPNYQTKVADPTGDGGKEVGIDPIINSFGEMSVQDKPKNRFTTGTGSHDQFSPEPLPSLANNAAGDDKGEEIHGGGDQTSKPTSTVTEYGKKIASAVTETLSPVYGKVAEAGSAVVAKVQGTGNSEARKVGGGDGAAPDKGVSMTSYLAEKMNPGDDDRALSEVISCALQRRKKSNAEEEEEKEEGKELKSEPTRKVTESEEVARSLGTGKGEGTDSGDVKFDSGSNVSSGSSVVDKLRGAVSSWFGKGGDDSQTSAQPQPTGGVPAGGSGKEGGEGRANEVAVT